MWETFKEIFLIHKCDTRKTIYNKKLVRIIFSKLASRTMLWGKQKCTFGKPVYFSGVHI
jgi:hypothetical protein